MNKNSYSQILEHVARDGLKANTDLAPRIMARIQKGKSTTMQPRTKVFATVFLILLVLAIGLISVPSVRAAFQHWISYVPGIGLVSDGRLRVLAEPVAITRDGITLTVEQVLVDSAQTTVVYSIEGLSIDTLDANPIMNRPGCYQNATLRLPESELSTTNQIGTSWITGYQHKAIYPVIPSNVNEVTLRLPCIRSALPGKAPENWELSFQLIPAPPELTAFPVIEISTPTEATSTAQPPMDASTSLSPDGISLTFDRAIQMDDGYLIYLTLHWENTSFNSVDMFDTTAFHMLDANGQEISYTLDHDAMNSFTWQRGQTAFALRTATIPVAGPVTLVIDSAAVTVAVPVVASFTFDPGPDPQPGQVWEINRDLDVGYGHSLRVLRATYPKPPLESLPQQAGFSFDLESQTGISNATLFDFGNPMAGGGGGGSGSFSNVFSSGFSYAGAMPQGPITVNVESITVNLPGPWKATWTPPESQSQTMPTSQGAACITRESWQQALQAYASLPTGLTGTLALSRLLPPDYQYEAAVAKLDGSDLKPIGYGFTPSLSPDKRRAVYVGPAINQPAEGLYITDLASGSTTLLPGTTTGDMGPIWSPDGQKIAFTRGPSSGLMGAPGPYSVMVTNIDGSELRQLSTGSEVSYAATWMPDGNHLLYTVPSRDRVSIHNMDIYTGETNFLFDINYNGTVAISPDGKRVAFEEMLPLEKYGLFVSNLDGSNRKLLADGDPYIVTIPAWSPDGNWVIASLHSPGTTENPNPNAILTLIQVDTCQIVALKDLSGYVSSWLP